MFNDAMKGVGADKATLSAFKASQGKMTQEVKSQAKIREALAREESQVRVIQARTAAQQSAEIERRKTATLKAELKKREREERQSGQRITNAQRVAGQVRGVAGLAAGGLAAVGVAFGAREAIQATVEMANLRTEVLRSNVAFETLSGGVESAATNLRAVKEAGGGTLDTLKAQQVATQALTLGLANNAEELKRVVTAGRLIATVSPVIHDASSAISELGLAAANTSYRRLDQLGLSVGEVKDRMKELQAANGDLSESQAFLAASLDIIDSKFGSMADSAAFAASGAESLAASWKEVKIAVAESGVGDAVNTTFTQAAYGITLFSGSLDPLQENIKQVSSILDGLNQAVESNSFFLGGKGRLKQTAANFDLLKKTLDDVNDAVVSGVPDAEHYADTVNKISQEAVLQGRVTKDQVVALNEVARQLGAATDAAQLFALKQHDLAAATAAANAELDAQAAIDPLAKYRPAAVAAQQRYAGPAVGYDNTSALKSLDIYSTEKRDAADKKAAEDAAKAWAKAADTTAKSWESEIKSALQSVPGLFGKSEVTQSDLEAAKAGTYVAKADEYLRQLKDTVYNGKQYAGVDIQDAAKRAGIDPTLPVKEIYRQFEEAWNNSSLFAEGMNLDLINQDAVQAAIDKAKKSDSGKTAIMNYFAGVYGPEVAAELFTGAAGGAGGTGTTGTTGTAGLDGSMTIHKVILAAGATFDIDQFPDFAGALLPAMYDSIFGNENAVNDLKLIGKAIVQMVNTGYNAGAAEFSWLSGPMAAAQDEAAAMVLDAMNAAVLGG